MLSVIIYIFYILYIHIRILGGMFTQNGKKGGCKTGILTAQNSQKLKEKIALSMANVNLDNVNNDKKVNFFLGIFDCLG